MNYTKIIFSLGLEEISQSMDINSVAGVRDL